MNRFRPYSAESVSPAYSLRYVWYGWLSAGNEVIWPSGLSSRIAPLWESDGIRVLNAIRRGNCVAMTFSTTPAVSPVLLAQRAKGRLAYQLRTESIEHAFSRKIAVRSIGENTSKQVECYISKQVENENFVDPRFHELLSQFHVHWKDVDLSKPTEAKRSRYWNDLHVVLVTQERFRLSSKGTFEALRDRLLSIREREDLQYKSLQLMPDHLHLLLRSNIEKSPSQIVELLQNETAAAIDIRAWKDTYYVGTTGEFSMSAIRS